MPRIIAGSLKGRRLASPKGAATRPTSDRVRESLFSRLEGLMDLTGARVLDLYSGTGALGIETVSRGATWVTMVEQHRATAALIGRNVVQLGIADRAKVVNASVERVLGRGSSTGPYDLVLADPPYPLSDETVVRMLEHLIEYDWLSERATVVVERSSRAEEPRWPAPLQAVGGRTYGDTTVYLAERVDDEPSTPEPQG